MPVHAFEKKFFSHHLISLVLIKGENVDDHLLTDSPNGMREICVDETGENCEENEANGAKFGLYPMCPVAGDRSASRSAAAQAKGSASGSPAVQEIGS